MTRKKFLHTKRKYTEKKIETTIKKEKVNWEKDNAYWEDLVAFSRTSKNGLKYQSTTGNSAENGLIERYIRPSVSTAPIIYLLNYKIIIY